MLPFNSTFTADDNGPLAAPLFTHCCHCTWCQRETGSAFVLNALIEARYVHLTRGTPDGIDTPSESGRGQRIFRCPTCQVAVWSVYAGAGPRFLFVRAGTLRRPVTPDIHIFTSSKVPWLRLDDGIAIKEGGYVREEAWPADSLARRNAELARSD